MEHVALSPSVTPKKMSTPQPSASGQSQPYSQQLAKQFQHNEAHRYPHYTPRVHYAPSTLQPGVVGPGSSQQQPGPTAQFLQAGMQSGRPSTPYQQTGQSTSTYQYSGYGLGSALSSGSSVSVPNSTSQQYTNSDPFSSDIPLANYGTSSSWPYLPWSTSGDTLGDIGAYSAEKVCSQLTFLQIFLT